MDFWKVECLYFDSDRHYGGKNSIRTHCLIITEAEHGKMVIRTMFLAEKIEK